MAAQEPKRSAASVNKKVAIVCRRNGGKLHGVLTTQCTARLRARPRNGYTSSSR
jgi:hypothetical protein